jgi:hypothetical protein
MIVQAMAIAGLFPEVPSRGFQMIDSTTSRPSTAGPNRAASGKKAADLTKAVTNALSEGVMVSAADCLHACHAHLTDPQNFWKCINDA